MRNPRNEPLGLQTEAGSVFFLPLLEGRGEA